MKKKLRVNVKNTDPKYWEKILEKQTLWAKQLGLNDGGRFAADSPTEDMLPQAQILTNSRKTRSKDRDLDFLRTKIDGNDPFFKGHGIKKIRTREKEIPTWAMNNRETQKLLLKAFPKLKTDAKQNKSAARWAAIITYFYRMNMTYSQIGAELKTSAKAVEHIIWRIHRVARGGAGRGRPRKKLAGVSTTPL